MSVINKVKKVLGTLFTSPVPYKCEECGIVLMKPQERCPECNEEKIVCGPPLHMLN